MVKVGPGAKLTNCRFYFEGTDNEIEIREGANLNGVEFILRYGGKNKIIVGQNTTTGGSCQFEASEGSTVSIGSDCMFSHYIHIMTTDHHSIIYNGKRVNLAKDVIIGNHCWIGLRTVVLKGSVIPNGSIVGAHSTYSGINKDENSIYAGNPAKLLKKDICWDRRRL